MDYLSLGQVTRQWGCWRRAGTAGLIRGVELLLVLMWWGRKVSSLDREGGRRTRSATCEAEMRT